MLRCSGNGSFVTNPCPFPGNAIPRNKSTALALNDLLVRADILRPIGESTARKKLNQPVYLRAMMLKGAVLLSFIDGLESLSAQLKRIYMNNNILAGVAIFETSHDDRTYKYD